MKGDFERSRLRVLLVGAEAAGTEVLRAISHSNARIIAVMASPGSAATFSSAAEQLGFPIWSAELVKAPAFAHKVKEEEVDVLINVHSLYIIHRDVLQAVRVGAFNMHPGPLPRYAGLNTVSWAIYRGETNHAVTIHRMIPAIDAGSVVYEAAFPIEETDTPLSLTHKCVKAGVPLILKLLETAAANPEVLPIVQQDLSRRRYFGREVPQSGWLSWARPAQEVVNFVRACDYFPYRSPWGHPKTKLSDREISVLKATRTGKICQSAPGVVGKSDESGVEIACGDEWVCVRRLKIDGLNLRPDDVLKPGDQLAQPSQLPG